MVRQEKYDTAINCLMFATFIVFLVWCFWIGMEKDIKTRTYYQTERCSKGQLVMTKYCQEMGV